MRTAFLLIGIGIAAATFSVAEEPQSQVFPLKAEEPPAFPGETRCKPLFVVRSYGKSPDIFFKYEDNGKDVIDSIPTERASTEVGTDQKNPEVEKWKNEQGITFARFWLSPDSYKASKACVPPPKGRER